MKRFTHVAVLSALAGLLVGTAFSAPRGQGRQQEKETVQQQVEQIIAECKLDDKQQADLKEKAKAKEAALAAWDTANGEKLKAAEDAVKAARTGDADTKKKAGAALKDLQADREKAGAEATAAMLAVLTPEQKAAWDGHVLATTTLAKYRRANLTDDQTAKIKQACCAAATVISANPGDDKSDKKARTEIMGKLQWAIENVIMTADQGQMFARKPKGGAATAAPAPATAPATPAPATPAPAAPATPATPAK